MLSILMETTVIHDITTTDEILSKPGLIWWQSAFILIGSLLLLSFLFVTFKKGKTRKKRVILPIEKAIQELRSLNYNDDTSAFAVETSTIIRSYLNSRTNNSSLFQTNEEFAAHSFSSLQINEQSKASLTEFLQSLNHLKYNQQAKECNPELIKQNAVKILEQVEKSIGE